jgi:hypothetical protein
VQPIIHTPSPYRILHNLESKRLRCYNLVNKRLSCKPFASLDLAVRNP